jgi:hypothetical protein
LCRPLNVYFLHDFRYGSSINNLFVTFAQRHIEMSPVWKDMKIHGNKRMMMYSADKSGLSWIALLCFWRSYESRKVFWHCSHFPRADSVFITDVVRKWINQETLSDVLIAIKRLRIEHAWKDIRGKFIIYKTIKHTNVLVGNSTNIDTLWHAIRRLA